FTIVTKIVYSPFTWNNAVRGPERPRQAHRDLAHPRRLSLAAERYGLLVGPIGGLRVDREAGHHAALVVFGDVAVGHPDARVGHFEQDLDRLAGRHQDGVVPDEVGLDGSAAGGDQEGAGRVDLE